MPVISIQWFPEHVNAYIVASADAFTVSAVCPAFKATSITSVNKSQPYQYLNNCTLV